MVTITLKILLVILWALHDAYVIKSYGKTLNVTYKNYWHYVKFCLVILSGWLICGLSVDLIQFYLIYYAFFEPFLNLFRRKGLFYLGDAASDKWRIKLFGKYVSLVDGVLKGIALGIIILIEIKKYV